MSIWEFIFEGSAPKEAPPFKSLWLPFDHMTWILVSTATIVMSFTLHTIERSWSHFQGSPQKHDGKNAPFTLDTFTL